MRVVAGVEKICHLTIIDTDLVQRMGFGSGPFNGKKIYLYVDLPQNSNVLEPSKSFNFDSQNYEIYLQNYASKSKITIHRHKRHIRPKGK